VTPIKPLEQPKAKEDNREELDFKFDEELPSSPGQTKVHSAASFVPAARRRTTSLTLDPYNEEHSDFELDDDDIDKILIITPTPPSHRKQHKPAENQARPGESTPRARMTAELAKIIDDGLKWYEKALWQDRSATVRYFPGINLSRRSPSTLASSRPIKRISQRRKTTQTRTNTSMLRHQ
jgi:la-related protein 1